MRYLKTFEQKTEETPYNKIKGFVKDKVKQAREFGEDQLAKGGMWFIKNTEEYKNLESLAKVQQELLDKMKKKEDYVDPKPGAAGVDKNRNGKLDIQEITDKDSKFVPPTFGGMAAQEMLIEWGNSLDLLQTTINEYVKRQIDANQVRKRLDEKIADISSKPAPLNDVKIFKQAAIDFLTMLKKDVTPWLI